MGTAEDSIRPTEGNPFPSAEGARRKRLGVRKDTYNSGPRCLCEAVPVTYHPADMRWEFTEG